jgi:hypothetical protein
LRYNGEAGEVVSVPLAIMGITASPEKLAAEMWSRLQAVKWDSRYNERAKGLKACGPAPQHQALRGGLYGHAYYCAQEESGVIAESFYYPVNSHQPQLLLRRADLRLANGYPEMSAEVQELLIQRLTRAYGKGSTPEHLYEIGATLPQPGLSWQAGPVRIFLHRNRNYVNPVGVREGVLMVAVHRDVLAERKTAHQLNEASGASAFLSRSVVLRDLREVLGDYYIPVAKRPETEADRIPAERSSRTALLRLLRQRGDIDRNKRAAILVAADDLVVVLGGLLVARQVTNGSERLGEASNAGAVRRQLAPYGIRYKGIGHYSGDLEYDRSLLLRAWREFPATPWGQRAFLMLNRLSCAIPEAGCDGPNCFRLVIRQVEKFLEEYPETPYRTTAIYHLALANETWWSLSQAGADDVSAQGAKVDKASGETARLRAIELFERLIESAPGASEAGAARLALPRLKLRLGTGERTFFCFSC